MYTSVVCGQVPDIDIFTRFKLTENLFINYLGTNPYYTTYKLKSNEQESSYLPWK